MSFDLAIKIGVQGAGAATGELNKTAAAAEQAGARIEGANKKAGESARSVGDELGRLRGAWHGLAGAVGIGIGVTQMVQMADAVTTLMNRLQLATGSATAAAKVYGDLYRVAQASHVSFTELGVTYATMARAGEAMGVSQARLMTVTQAVGQAMAIGGGRAEGMRAALVQLGQGMSAGVLRGEELNSVMEQAPRLASALADGLGVPIGQLRRLGEEGELTSARVMDALERSAPQLAREIASSGQTVSQAFTQLGNATTYFTGRLDEATGFSGKMASAISGLSGALTTLADFIKANETTFGIVAGALAGAAALAGYGLLKIALLALVPIFGAVAGAVALVSAPVLAIAAAIAAIAAGVKAFRGSETGLTNRIASMEGGNSIYGPRGQEKTDELARLRALLAEKQTAGQTSAVNDARRVDAQIETAATAEREANLTRLVEIKRKLAGVDQDYIKTVQSLSEAVALGNISSAEYVRLVKEATAATKAGKDAAKDATEAQKKRHEMVAAHEKAQEAEWKAWLDAEKQRSDATAKALIGQMKMEDAAGKELESLKDQVKAQRAANAALLDGSDAVKVLEQAKLRDAAVTADRLALHAMERLENEVLAEQYREQGRLLRELSSEKERGGVITAAVKEAKETQDAWKRATDSIADGLTDALMRGFENGRGFIDNFKQVLVNAFKTMVLRPVIEAQVRAGSNVLGNFLGNGSGGGSGGLGNPLQSMIGNYLSGLGASVFGSSAAYGAAIGTTSIGAGSQAAMLAQQTGSFGAAGLAATSSAAAGAGGGFMASAAAAGPWVALAAVVAAKAVNDSQRGFNRDQAKDVQKEIGSLPGTLGLGVGGFESDFANGLEKMGLNKRWADILSGSTAVAKLLGYGASRVTDQGIVGSISGGGVDAQGFQDSTRRVGTVRRYFGGKDKMTTDYAALGSDLAGLLDESAADVLAGVNAWAKSLGLPAERLAGISTQIRVSMTGDDAKDRAAIIASFQAYQADLVKGYEGVLADLRKFGESTVHTLQRLAGLQMFSDTLNSLGGIFSRVALLGVDARESMIALAGGMDALQSKALGFIQNYYSREEIAGGRAREVQTALQGVGLDASSISATDPRAQFRALVEGVNVSTEEGRTQLATLLNVQESFAGIADYLTEVGGTLGSVAAQAPEMGSLGPLFASGTSQQVNATNAVRDAVDQMRDALLGQMRAGGGGGLVMRDVRGGGGGRGGNEVVNIE